MTFKNDLVSIGVPTFNRPEQLRNCLNGLVEQTYLHLQIIISDNCSTHPEVALVAEEFSRKDSRIIYVRQKSNIGAINNFQYVLSRADGEYFMWAADDDYRDPIYVEELVKLLLTHDDSVLSFCDFYEMTEDGLRAAGYPQHAPLLAEFSTGNQQIRLLKYFFQFEGKGKANPIYGLIRRRALSHFCFQQFASQHGEYGIDMLFVFMLMNKGSLAITPMVLYRCTVGNKKSPAKVQTPTNSAKLRFRLMVLAEQLRYATRYVALARGGTRFLLIVCLPLKVVQLFTFPVVALIRRKISLVFTK